ncbi:MAG: hypothetical protein WCW31_01150 [Patescibacteria group bacterium]
MLKALWLISLVFLVACHAQAPAAAPAQPKPKTSFRLASVLFNKFMIITVEEPSYAKVRCADADAQKTYRDLRELSEILLNVRMMDPGLYYEISIADCVCEGFNGYQVERRSSEVVVHCKKGG